MALVSTTEISCLIDTLSQTIPIAGGERKGIRNNKKPVQLGGKTKTEKGETKLGGVGRYFCGGKVVATLFF